MTANQTDSLEQQKQRYEKLLASDIEFDNRGLELLRYKDYLYTDAKPEDPEEKRGYTEALWAFVEIAQQHQAQNHSQEFREVRNYLSAEMPDFQEWEAELTAMLENPSRSQ